MKHLLKKISSRGGGSKKPKVTPGVLNPPSIGDFEFGASFSVAENIDLISDGPIEGLVDPEGNKLSRNQISRGVYLDDTAVSVANKDFDPNAPISSSFTINIEELDFAERFKGNVRNGWTHFTIRYMGGTWPLGNAGNAIPMIHGFRNDSFQDWRTLDGKTYENMRSTDKVLDKDSYGDGIMLGPENGNTKSWFNIEGSDHNYGYVQLNCRKQEGATYVAGNPSTIRTGTNKAFSKSTLIYFTGASDVSSRTFLNSRRNIENLEFFFNERAKEESITSEGAMTPFIDLLNELKSLVDVDGTIKNQTYYDLIETTLTNALGDHDWRNVPSGELEKLVFPGISDGHILMYYPDRDILDQNGHTGKVITNTENLQFEFTSNGSVVAIDKASLRFLNVLVPVINENNELTGDVIGAIFIMSLQHVASFTAANGAIYRGSKFPFAIREALGRITTLSLTHKYESNLKYNYSNVLIEQKLGEESQGPLNFFNKISIDQNYNRVLYGPYRNFGEVQRVRLSSGDTKLSFRQNTANLGLMNDDGLGLSLRGGGEEAAELAEGEKYPEGSNDAYRRSAQGRASFSDWAAKNVSNFNDEEAVSVTHIVHNPNVAQASITLRINSLYDSLEKELNTSASGPDAFKPGDKIPAIVNIAVEVGLLERDGNEKPYISKIYRIVSLVETVTLLDIGNPDQGNSPTNYRHVMAQGRDPKHDEDINVPFDLPPVYSNASDAVDGSLQKRYVKVTKLSTETFSVLISKDVMLSKVTEIIPSYFTYPFSAVFGVKVDTRTFSNIPQRTYDARLKRIKIPSNYFPTSTALTSKDKRYYKTEKELEESDALEKQLYIGDWDGSFKEGWTDNPAWILFDLLTSTRYGLGQQVSETEINKWELYKIGRFCDAVDENGNFVGVSDGRGGLEPRFSCNILFNSKEKIFDAIQLISNLFRGKTFFRNSEISFIDQRIKEPIATFSNINVKDGIFNYSNFRRDQQFNTVEVAYKDRFENFAPKIEVIEDAEDIRNRGVFKTTIEAAGVTSRAMALRIGEHLIYKTIKENQRVAFSSGLEALLCQPGDLIIIDDELKSNKSNFGKIMSVDTDSQYIRLSGPFSPTSMTGVLTVYNPTGQESISGLNALATKKRHRYESFSITGDIDADFNVFTGDYSFSGYKDGYSTGEIEEHKEENDLFEEYACYTGTGDNVLYFNTGFTGWVFASGLIYQDNEDNDKFISDTGFGGNTLYSINESSGVYKYDDDDTTDRRSRTQYRDLSGHFSGLSQDIHDYGGILESEIGIGTPSQIVTLNVAGGGSVGDVVGERGSFVSGVDKPEFLSIIKVGSPYRYDIKNASDIIYQIDSIKEDNPNEYLVAAIKFDTGKYDLIEKNISIDRKENTFAYSVATQVGDKIYTNLDQPTSLVLTTGEDAGAASFFISGAWPQVANNNGYNVNLHYPNGVVKNSSISQNVTGVKFTGITSVGNFFMAVKALGDQTSDSTNVYFDSEYTTTRSFFLYENIASLDRPIITNINFR